MVTEFATYPEWKAAALERDLVFAGKFKAFDRNSNFFGYFNWPGLEPISGWLSDTAGELVMEVKTVKLKVTAIKKIPNIWVMTIDSTNIKSCAYDYLHEHLYVQFHTSKTIYRYNDIPIEYWLGMTETESIGTYFQKSKHLLVDYSKIVLKAKSKEK